MASVLYSNGLVEEATEQLEACGGLAAFEGFPITARIFCDASPPPAPAIQLDWDPIPADGLYRIWRDKKPYSVGLVHTRFSNNLNVIPLKTYSYQIVFETPGRTVRSETIKVAVPDGLCGKSTGAFSAVARQKCSLDLPDRPIVLLQWTPSANAEHYSVVRNGAEITTNIHSMWFVDRDAADQEGPLSYMIRAHGDDDVEESQVVLVTLVSDLCPNAQYIFPKIPGNFHPNNMSP